MAGRISRITRKVWRSPVRVPCSPSFRINVPTDAFSACRIASAPMFGCGFAPWLGRQDAARQPLPKRDDGTHSLEADDLSSTRTGKRQSQKRYEDDSPFTLRHSKIPSGSQAPERHCPGAISSHKVK